jgi:hypothetical protein
MYAQTGSEVQSSSYPVGIEGYFTWRKAAESWIWALISTSCEVKNARTLLPLPVMPCHCARLSEVELKIEVVLRYDTLQLGTNWLIIGWTCCLHILNGSVKVARERSSEITDRRGMAEACSYSSQCYHSLTSHQSMSLYYERYFLLYFLLTVMCHVHTVKTIKCTRP